MELRGMAMLKPVERCRGPRVVALKTNLAAADRPWWWRRFNCNRRHTRQHAGPEALLGLEEFDLVEPVGSDIEHLELVVAEDHRQRRLLVTGHGHVVLQLGHVALEHFFGLRKGTGVL